MARPLGSLNKDKPFREALRMELAALEDSDLRSLRGLARKLLLLAVDGDSALAAIREVADRLDGKPAQETEVRLHRITAKELPDDELADIATGSGEGTDPPPTNPAQLN